MDFTTQDIQIKGDRVLVKKLKYQEKVGSFYVPESVRDRKAKRRGDAWKAEVLGLGDKLDFTALRGTLVKGDIIYCAPVSLDCPAFSDDNGNELIIITQDDVLAREVDNV